MDKPKLPRAAVTEEAENFGVMVGIAVVLFTLILVLIVWLIKRKPSRRGVLVTGLCDSGKTLLYARLLNGKFVHTQTSIKENFGTYVTNAGSLQIIDIPGHERLRDKFFETHKVTSRGIVYVIDSQTIQKDIRDVAEFLYNILSDSIVSGNKPNLLIVCNKQDLAAVKSSSAIKKLLESEMNTLRITKSSQLESVDPNIKKNLILGNKDKPFEFDSLPKYDIEFVEAWGTDDKSQCNISAVKSWLAKIA